MVEEEEDNLYAPLFNANPCGTALPAALSGPQLGLVLVQKEASLIVMIHHGKTGNSKLDLFTGWKDVPLAVDGVDEAMKAGILLKFHGFECDAL